MQAGRCMGMGIIGLTQYGKYRVGSFMRRGRSISMYAFSSQKEGLISSMHEVTQGDRFYQQKNLPEAISYYQQSLNILPLYIRQNPEYNTELQALTSRLATSYLWKGQLGKVQTLTTKILQAATREQLTPGDEIQKISDVLSLVGKVQTPIHQQKYQILKELFISVQGKFTGKDANITSELAKPPPKGIQPNTSDLSPYLHSELKSTTAFVLLSLLTSPSFATNPAYNKLCNTLLKNAQKSSQKNVIKPLSLLITNLLRNGQYLQAEGMLQYCLQRKRENLKENLLRTNQEFILLELLLAKTFEGVQRLQQSRRIKQEFSSKLDLPLWLSQHLLLQSI